MPQESDPSFGFSDIRWFPILACSLVAGADLWYSVSTGKNDGKYVGIGFFAVFAVGAFQRWRLRGDRFHLVTIAGAVMVLFALALRNTDRFDRGQVLPYLAFILFCVLGSIPGHPSKRRKLT